MARGENGWGSEVSFDKISLGWQRLDALSLCIQNLLMVMESGIGVGVEWSGGLFCLFVFSSSLRNFDFLHLSFTGEI